MKVIHPRDFSDGSGNGYMVGLRDKLQGKAASVNVNDEDNLEMDMASPDPRTIEWRHMTRNERLTLTISTLALVVSGLSYVDNHLTVMPKIKVFPAATSMPLAVDPLNVPIWVTLRNEGHLDATITEIDATPISAVPDAQDACNRDLLNAETKSTLDFGPLADIPKDQRRVGRINPYITLPKSCSQVPPVILVALVIKYHDFLHIPYSQTDAVRVILAKDPVTTSTPNK